MISFNRFNLYQCTREKLQCFCSKNEKIDNATKLNNVELNKNSLFYTKNSIDNLTLELNKLLEKQEFFLKNF